MARVEYAFRSADMRRTLAAETTLIPSSSTAEEASRTVPTLARGAPGDTSTARLIGACPRCEMRSR